MERGSVNITAVILIIFLLGGLAARHSGILNNRNGLPFDDKIQCQISGCNGELCVKQGLSVSSACSWQPSFACYSPEFTECIQISETECGWSQTPGLQSCLQGNNVGSNTGTNAERI